MRHRFYLISRIRSAGIYNVNLLKRKKTLIENFYSILQLGVYKKTQKTFKIERFTYLEVRKIQPIHFSLNKEWSFKSCIKEFLLLPQKEARN